MACTETQEINNCAQPVEVCPDVVIQSTQLPPERFVRQWSNNPVWITRFLMRNFPYTVVKEAWFDDVKNYHTAQYCFTVVEDDTDAEMPVVSSSDYESYQEEQWQRLRSENRYGTVFQQAQDFINDYMELMRPDIWWTSPINQPTVGQSRTYLTNRFTCNGVINDKAKLADVLFSLVLPTFRGFLRFNMLGKIEIDCRKPVRQSFIRADMNAGVDSIPVQNVMSITRGNHVHGNLSGMGADLESQTELSELDYVLIGVGKNTSEVARITGVRYVNGNEQTVVAASSSGAMGVVCPTAFIDRQSAPSEITIDFSGTPVAGERIELKFTEPSGEVLVWDYYVDQADINLDIVVQMFKTRLVASPRFRETWTADVFSGFPHRIVVRCQTGYINIDKKLTHQHLQGEELIRVVEIYEDGRDPVHKDGVKDNMRNFRYNVRKQETYHGVKPVYVSAVQDFRETEILSRIAWDAAEEERNLNLLELDLRFVDNYRQAAWLGKSATIEFVDGNLWASWGTGIRGLFHEEGDVVAVRHQTMEGISWTPFCIQNVAYDDSQQETKLEAKIYFSAAFDDRIAKEEKFLESSLATNEEYQATPPPILNSGGFSTTRTGDGAGDNAQGILYETYRYDTFPQLQKYSPEGRDIM